MREQPDGMLRCPNCGALYKEGLKHCPYCRSVDDYQDESEYLEDLDDLKDRLEVLPGTVIREENRRQTKEAARDFAVILRRIGITAGIILLLFAGLRFVDRAVLGNSEENRLKEQKEEYLWKQENFKKLDEMYANKDYEGLLEFDENCQNSGIYDWEHYPLLEGLKEIRFAETEIRTIEHMIEEKKTESDEYTDSLAMLLRDELELEYFDMREAAEEDREIVRERSAVCREDLQSRFSLTEEERSRLEEQARKNHGSFLISECRDFLKNRR